MSNILSTDFWRNFGSWITEKLTVPVEWSSYLVDLRLGYKVNNKWCCKLEFFKEVTQNFWNGIFTFNIYIVKTKILTIPFFLPRINIVSRFSYNYWFEAGIGYLFDRGEFGIKLVIMNYNSEEIYNPGVNASGWNEGPV